MAETNAEPMCYVAQAPCGCYRYAAVDLPEFRADTAEDIKKMILNGWTIERKPVSFVRSGGLNLNCNCENEDADG